MSFESDWKQAFESLDGERILALFSPDIEFRSPGLEQPIKGRDQLRPWFGALDTIDSLDIKAKKQIQRGPDLALLVDVDVAFKDDLHYGDITIPAGGKTTHIEAALFVTLDENGRAKEMVRIRNDYQIMKDLGMKGEEMDDLMERAQQLVRQHAESPGTERPA